MAFRLPSTDDRKANRLEDAASRLDAGLGLDGSAHPQASLVDALVTAGIPLDSIERRVLGAAEAAGTLPRALRDRARTLRSLTALKRSLTVKLAYPTFLLIAAVGLSLWLSFLGGGERIRSLVITADLLAGGVTILAWWTVHRARTQTAFPWWTPPPVRQSFVDLSMLNYLTTLRALYAAGVPVLEAHEIAAPTATAGEVRAGLWRARGRLERDRIPLADALASEGAVDTETQDLIAIAERSGDLESGLERAATRRRDVFERRLGRIAVAVGAIAYLFAATLIGMIVITFYGTILGSRY